MQAKERPRPSSFRPVVRWENRLFLRAFLGLLLPQGLGKS
jgi:hypothetical protein